LYKLQGPVNKQSVSEEGVSHGATPVGSSLADFDAFMRAEARKWKAVLKPDIKMQ
jgi:hypothetical protein